MEAFRQQSGARISISKAQASAPERIVTITGGQTQIRKACELITEKIDKVLHTYCTLYILLFSFLFYFLHSLCFFVFIFILFSFYCFHYVLLACENCVIWLVEVCQNRDYVLYNCYFNAV